MNFYLLEDVPSTLNFEKSYILKDFHILIDQGSAPGLCIWRHLAASGNHIDTMQTSKLCLHLSFLAKLQINEVIVASQCSFY